MTASPMLTSVTRSRSRLAHNSCSPRTMPRPTVALVNTAMAAQALKEQEFREMMKYFKANAAYIVADGENLMIVAPDEQAPDTEDAVPELKPSVNMDEKVVVSYRKGDFGGLELQWRKVGETMWQLADKSTEKIITFTPEGITPPQKIELRGVFLLKNQRVGIWSPIYTLTVG